MKLNFSTESNFDFKISKSNFDFEIEPYSPWADTFFWLHSGDKTWYGFLVTSGCLLSRKLWWVFWIGSSCPKLRYFTDQNGPKGEITTSKWILTIFKYKNECYKQLERKKWMKKNGVICLASMFNSWVMAFKCPKRAFFTILCWPQQEVC